MTSIFIDNEVDNTVQDQIYDAIVYCMDVLMPNLKNIEIDVTVEEDFGYEAQAGVSDEDTKKVPTKFEINIDQNSLEDTENLIETICHEMVHIKQYATGELKTIVENGSNVFVWKGEKIIQNGNISLATYYNYPWEVEAYGIERGLYHGLLENKKIIETIKQLAA